MMPSTASIAFVVCTALMMPLSSAPAHADGGRPRALSLLPDDTALIMSVDVKRLASNELASDLLTLLTREYEFQELNRKLLNDAGIDMARDIRSIVLGIAGDINRSDRIVVAIEGSFDQDRLTGFLRANARSFVRKRRQGKDYYRVDGNEFGFFGSYFVVTPRGGMRRVIDAHSGGQTSVRYSSELANLADDARTQRPLWLALVLPKHMRTDIASETGGHYPTAVIAGIDMTADIDISLLMDTSSARTASALASAFRAGGQEIAKDPSLAVTGVSDVFKHLTVKSTGSHVELDLVVAGANVQRMIGLLEQLL